MHAIPTAQPTDEEALRKLEVLLTRDAAAKDQLATLEVKVAQFRTSRQRLQKGIYYYKALLSPVRRLPVEVLGHIFGFLVVAAPDAVFQASRVCRTWRSAAMFSQLWSNIVIASETHATIQKAQLYLERARDVPLSVAFIQSRLPRMPWPAWNAIKSSVYRWSSLSLTLDDCSLVSLAIRSLPAVPSLTDLSIIIRGSCVDTMHDGLFGFEPGYRNKDHRDSLAGSPFLRTLHLSTWILPTPGYLFPMLTKLTITDTFSSLQISGASLSPMQGKDLMGLLRYCHNLEEFTFNAEGTINWFVFHSTETDPDEGQPGQHVSLVRLRRLHLHCHYSCLVDMFPCIHAPNLESASLLMRPRYEASESKVLEKVTLRFLRNCQDLKVLHIHACPGLAMIAAMVVGFPQLESLHLDHSPTPDVVVRALWINDLFNYFTQPTWLVPKLSNLVIDAQPLDLSHENLSVLVKSRYYNNLEHGTPCFLESFVVNGRNMLKGVPPGEIVESDRIIRFGGQTWEMHQGRSIYPKVLV